LCFLRVVSPYGTLNEKIDPVLFFESLCPLVKNG
jgi:hypothetical protein